MAIPELVEPFKGVVDAYERWFSAELAKAEEEERAAGGVYFHYTDAAGLEGIFKNEEFWLTSIYHLNDPSELRYGVNLALDEFERQSEGAVSGVKFILNRVRETLEKLPTLFTFVVGSFSREMDDLGQWRAYGDDGRGFSIGISAQVVKGDRSAQSSDRNVVPVLAKVIYDETAARKRQGEVVRRAIEAVETCYSDRKIKDPQFGVPFAVAISTQLALSIVWNAVTTKHPAYANERESRLIVVRRVKAGTPGVETRARGSELVPFMRFKVPIREKDNLDRILIGPAAKPQAEDGVVHLLRSYGIDSAGKIERSRIPYRSRR